MAAKISAPELKRRKSISVGDGEAGGQRVRLIADDDFLGVRQGGAGHSKSSGGAEGE
jgi:hypothetical protein